MSDALFQEVEHVAADGTRFVFLIHPLPASADVAPSPTYETAIVAGEIGARWEFWGSDTPRE